MLSISFKTLAWSCTVESKVVTTLTRPPGLRPEQFVTGPCSAPSWAADPHCAPGFSINKIWFLRLVYSQPPAPRFQGLGMPTRKETRSVIPVTNNCGSYSATGKWLGSEGGVQEQQSLILVVISLSDVKPVLADEARIWPSAQPPFVIGEGAPEHSDCQQNCSQSGFTVCSRLFFFLPLSQISYFSLRWTANFQSRTPG